MTPSDLAPSARIRKAPDELEQVVARCREIWRQAAATGDDRYIDGVALKRHAFHTGLERILELIAAEVDQVRPGGSAWPQALLRQARCLGSARPSPRTRRGTAWIGTAAFAMGFARSRHSSRTAT